MMPIVHLGVLESDPYPCGAHLCRKYVGIHWHRRNRSEGRGLGCRFVSGRTWIYNRRPHGTCNGHPGSTQTRKRITPAQRANPGFVPGSFFVQKILSYLYVNSPRQELLCCSVYVTIKASGGLAPRAGAGEPPDTKWKEQGQWQRIGADLTRSLRLTF